MIGKYPNASMIGASSLTGALVGAVSNPLLSGLVAGAIGAGALMAFVLMLEPLDPLHGPHQ